MSRIGKLPITIPDGVTLTEKDSVIEVKGQKGSLTQALVPAVTITVEKSVIQVSVKDENDKQQRALWGLYRALIANMIEGVTKGFEKRLEINGVGYKAAVQGTKVTLNLGYSHPIDFVLPEGITASVAKNVMTISGIDKQLVGETAAKIRELRKPEPYKGKGIKYIDEVIRRKAGKVVKTAGG